ncbi:unnamed protein product [Rotaria sordida]|uniref:Bromo domain-containing protein n=1 Tax=Rotaria sordida TaxID=392033 RepID=A0A815R243_9BILA|nr:unnamed protein product [Rotaria sordida]
MFRRGTKRPRFSVGGHTIFEHDDSSNHSGLGMADYEEDSSSQQQATTTTNSSDSNFLFNQLIPDRPRRIQKSITKTHNDDNTNLNACLHHLLRILSRKDKEGFFQYPVTDQFAPGYSQIILRPIDFSTMKRKINQDDYSNIIEFRSDFELMCDNAMKYNRPDTIYWQAAKKLLATGTKLMNKDKLISFRRSLECFSRLTERELGFRIDSLNHNIDEQLTISQEQYDSSINEHENFSTINLNQTYPQRKPKLILKLPKFYEKISTSTPDDNNNNNNNNNNNTNNNNDDDDDGSDELSPEEILSQAQQAAQCVHDKLRLHHSLNTYTITYQRTNNITSLRVINQDDFSQHAITLTELNEDNLTSTLPIVNDNEKRYQLLARDFLDNGPFSSNISQYDSIFSSMSKEELDLLTHTYGSEFSAQYAVSLMDYVKDAGDLALAYVDRFLSVLTNGEHDNFIMKRREKQQKVEEEDQNNIADTLSTHNVSSIDSISSSDQIKLEPQIHTDNTIQHQQSDTKLNENSKLLTQLRNTQYNRLSQSSNELHQGIPSKQTNDSTNEYDLVEKVLFNFNDITSLSNGPEKLISSESIHHNLGIINNNEPSLSTFDTL